MSSGLLSDDGSLFIHLDWRECHYVKVWTDEIFGRDNFMNEIIWSFDFGGRSKRKWSCKHNNIFWYVKDNKNYTFNYDKMDRLPYMSSTMVGKEKLSIGKTPTTVWWSTIVPTKGKEKVGYPTQKPLKILERIIKVHSNPGDLTIDMFAGCYDSLTEVLTNNGWKVFSDVCDSDLICSLNPNTKNIEYVEFTNRITEQYIGNMISFCGRSCDLLVTPNHNMFVKERREDKYKIIRADNVNYYCINIPAYGHWTGKEFDINDSYLRFLGFWYGDGFKGSKYLIGFTQILAMGRQNKMTGAAEQYQYILRDESMHCNLGL